jgi:hypothetical protein
MAKCGNVVSCLLDLGLDGDHDNGFGASWPPDASVNVGLEPEMRSGYEVTVRVRNEIIGLLGHVYRPGAKTAENMRKIQEWVEFLAWLRADTSWVTLALDYRWNQGKTLGYTGNKRH